MDSAIVQLSVVVPAFEEAARIAAPLATISRYLAARGEKAEIVVVDDGSRDGTAALIRDVAAGLETPLRLVRYRRNRGKGFALKVGFAHALGERILFTDADLATPIEEADALLASLEDGYDMAIGSRKMSGARIEVHQPWLRETLGKTFTWLVRGLIAEVSDATCGFKAFRGEVGRTLFSRIRIDDWSFDAELLFLLARGGFKLKEMPVRWRDQTGTKVNLVRDAVASLIGLIRIRVNSGLGRYAEASPIDEEVEIWESPACQQPSAVTGASTGARA
jgi:dolichyl-phosphate beta-glucosyltransferase